MILISNDFCHIIKMYNFDPYSVFLLLMTASVLQGHSSEQTAKQIYSEVN